MLVNERIEYISNWIRTYSNNNFNLVIGISGGIDSAVTSTLCAKTKLKTILVSMPIRQNNNQHSLSLEHIEWLKSKFSNVESHIISLDKTFRIFKETMEKFQSDLAFANSRSRLRMLTLYQIAQSNNALVVGTGNKVEDFGIGFFTKYGDGGVDISPIADLLKSDVYLLAKELGIDKEIIQAPPTDGLWIDNKTDEEQIGATYAELEWAMNFSGDEKLLDSRQKEVIKIYTKFNKKTKHKMIPIPVCKIPKDLL